MVLVVQFGSGWSLLNRFELGSVWRLPCLTGSNKLSHLYTFQLMERERERGVTSLLSQKLREKKKQKVNQKKAV